MPIPFPRPLSHFPYFATTTHASPTTISPTTTTQKKPRISAPLSCIIVLPRGPGPPRRRGLHRRRARAPAREKTTTAPGWTPPDSACAGRGTRRRRCRRTGGACWRGTWGWRGGVRGGRNRRRRPRPASCPPPSCPYPRTLGQGWARGPPTTPSAAAVVVVVVVAGVCFCSRDGGLVVVELSWSWCWCRS